MPETEFQTALAARVDDILSACTACGKCFEACPITGPAGLTGADPEAVVAGVLDILRTGTGPEPARKWASACILSGDCIDACGDGVNPRFMLTMARAAMARHATPPAEQRRQGVVNYRTMTEGVKVLSRLQLDAATLQRLGHGRERALSPTVAPGGQPDVVFYTGCNVLKTPHIALLCLDILDRLGVAYEVMGGPTHCCGVIQLRTGDTEVSGRMATSSIEKMAASRTGEVVSWCPSCQVQFTETTLPTYERATGTKPFDMTPALLFLARHLDRLAPMLTEPVPMRVALHRHPGVAGVVETAERLLRMVPGVELVELGQPAVGLMSNALAALPDYKRDLQRAELDAARDAGVDALAAVYHADHRELCAHELDYPFAIVNILEIVGASMGLARADTFKRLKKMQDADAIVEDCRDLIAAHGLDPAAARAVVAKAMLAEQPLALEGGGR
jgi:Fe-S oxidoreductase